MTHGGNGLPAAAAGRGAAQDRPTAGSDPALVRGVCGRATAAPKDCARPADGASAHRAWIPVFPQEAVRTKAWSLHSPGMASLVRLHVLTAEP